MNIQEFNIKLDQCRVSDRHRFERVLHRYSKQVSVDESLISKLAGDMDQSSRWVSSRRDLIQRLDIHYPRLPISDHKKDILAAIASSQVLILAGETGSGKTTQIPKLCMELGLGSRGLIGHTQPRRLAARAVAARIGEELNAPHLVGVKVRFSDQTHDGTLIKVMTDGMLLSEVKKDRFFEQYEALIIDEAHERSLNIDFLLGLIKLRLKSRPDLKVIIMSATIDVERFSRYFNGAPIITVKGRTFPVELHYRPAEELCDNTLAERVVAAIEDIQIWHHRASSRARPADVLVFLPGEHDIRECAMALRRAYPERWEILPLYARLTPAEQQRIFKSGRLPRIVLSTNVAETSLTVPNIGYVVDSGLVRISRYSARSGLQRLPVEAISKASAEQRAGRCGRVAEGVCIRLYELEDYQSRPDFTDPEITRTNLAQVVLSMLAMGISDVERFPFIDPPERHLIQHGFKRLQELGAVNSTHSLTDLGKQLARFSVDPTIARMIVAASELTCVYTILIIASALSINDPRERPLEKQQAADQMHRLFFHEESDFLSFVSLWEAIEAQRQALTRREWKEWLLKHYLNPIRVQEWRDVHRQLVIEAKLLQIDVSPREPNFEAIHKSLLSGLLAHVGQRGEKHDYIGIRHKQFYLHPSSSQFKRNPPWILSGQLVETHKVYARINAAIDPGWIEQRAAHCLKMTWQEPVWSARNGETMATRNSLLFGLCVGRHKAPYREYDVEAARLDLIRYGLVEGQFKRQPAWDFWKHNRQLHAQLHYEEEKLRRKDWVVSDEDLIAFYLKNLPSDIASQNQLDQWLRHRATAEQKQSLLMSEAFLRKGDESSVDWQALPDQLTVSGQTLKLEYRFEPGQEQDGVIYKVPFESLMHINPDCLDWLVPGLLREKCIELIKILPKSIRRKVVPAPQYADAFLASHPDKRQSLTQALADFLNRQANVEINVAEWHVERLSPVSHAHIHVINQHGELMAQGSDILALRRDLKHRVEEKAQRISTHWNAVTERVRWDFDDLPQTLTLKEQGRILVVYPRLVDEKDKVSVRCFAEEQEANDEHLRGVTRLLVLNAAEPRRYVEQKLFRPMIKQLIAFVELQDQQRLVDDSIEAIVRNIMLDYGTKIFTVDAFEACLSNVKSILVERAMQLARVVELVANSLAQVRAEMAAIEHPSRMNMINSIRQALKCLFAQGWLTKAYPQWIERYPVYLQSMRIRMQQYVGHVERDQHHTKKIEDWWELYWQRVKQHHQERINDPELQDMFWMLQEYSVSLFSQNLKTKYPVSEKRLLEQWEKVKKI